MNPKTLNQNLLLWAAAFALAVLLSFLSGIATHWPKGEGIDWQGVWLDVIQTVLTTAPIIAAGWGLPRLGKEPIATLVNEVGPQHAVAALEVEADRQAIGASPPTLAPTAEEIAAAYDRLRRLRAEDRLKQMQESRG